MALSIQSVDAGTDFAAFAEDAGEFLFTGTIRYGEFIHIRSLRFHADAAGTMWAVIVVHPTDGDNMCILFAGTTEVDVSIEDFTIPVDEDGAPYRLEFVTAGLTDEAYCTVDYTVKCEGTQ